MSKLTAKVTDLGFALGWWLTPLVPAGMARTVFNVAGEFAAARGMNRRGGVAQLRRNLQRVVPQAGSAELDELTRQAMKSYARYWREVFQLPSWNRGEVADRHVVEGRENLDAALAEGNGVVVAMPHTGNWDAAAVWMVHYYRTFTTVAERLRPESLYQRFLRFREGLGMEVFPLTGDGPVAPRLTARLRENRIVVLLADRDLTGNGIEVTLFGEKTTMPAGPAYLAARTGAALLPMSTWFTDDGWALRFHPPVRVASVREAPSATQQLADTFAGAIAAHPQDWHMLQPLWLSDRPGGGQRQAETDQADAR
jgi:KDO2-lipid IV(A) lauroyltransferase